MTIKDQEAGGREEIDWWLEAEEAALSQLDRLMAEEISDEIIEQIIRDICTSTDHSLVMEYL